VLEEGMKLTTGSCQKHYQGDEKDRANEFLTVITKYKIDLWTLIK